MVTYSYIPPEYNTPTKMPYAPSPLSQCTTLEPQEPNIPYRNTGAVGKYIFGQPPSFTFKPLPPFPFEEEDEKQMEREDDRDSMTTQVGDYESQIEAETKKEGKIAKAVKNFSRKLSTAMSKN